MKGQFDVLVWEKISFCNTNAAKKFIAKIEAKKLIDELKTQITPTQTS